MLRPPSRRLDPLEGVWSAAGANYRYAVLSGRAGGFDAVVLRADSIWWIPGQIKARLRRRDDGSYEAEYGYRDHSVQTRVGRLRQNVLVFDQDGIIWVREHPRREGDLTLAEYQATRNRTTAIARLGDSTLLLSIPSFGEAQAPIIDSLIRAHREELASTPYLIIDVRGNGGGSDFVYSPILPLIYTNPIVTVNASIYSTPYNIGKFEAILVDTLFPEAHKGEIRSLIARLKSNPGGLVRRDNDTTTYDRILPFPRRVGVIADRGCGSTCEQFVLAARESKKVTVFGTNTAGVLDYANVHRLDVPGGRFRLTYPTSRSQRLPNDPVDPMGIAPQVRVSDDELRVVEWVRRWLEQR